MFDRHVKTSEASFLPELDVLLRVRGDTCISPALAAAMASWDAIPMFATAELQKTMDPLFCFIMGRERHRSRLNDDPKLIAAVVEGQD